jgi:hypothetical protein
MAMTTERLGVAWDIAWRLAVMLVCVAFLVSMLWGTS